MIDEFSTFLCFGYYSDELTNGSHKKVWVVCDDCGKYRLISLKDYRDLCKVCAVKGERGPNYGKKFSNEHKLKISKNHADMSGKNNPMYNKFHSEEIRKKISENSPDRSGENNPMYGRTGENSPMYGKFREKNPNWNYNKTDEERKNDRSYPEYKEWRKSIYKRDNYICQKCGEIAGILNAHHLEGYANNKELRTTLENGITLCESCHKDFHHQYGKGNNTKQQFIEFIGSN